MALKIARRSAADLFTKCREFTFAAELEAQGLFPYFHAITSAQGPEVIVDGRTMVMAGSNNYLGLTTHPHVVEAAGAAVRRYGTGCTGSRFLNGTLDLHEAVEAKIARFKGKAAAVLFSTGYQTNLGTISCLVGRDEALVIDALDHASIIDGARASFARVFKFRHNDPADLARTLEQANGRGTLVVVDGVFSMEGDICRLPEVVAVCRRYGARLMVDDAHATGVLGAHGRGTAEHFGVEDDVDVLMGTCSKTLAAVGGFIAGDADVVGYVKHHARALIFSAALPPADVAAIGAALDVIEREPERRERLWRNARALREGLRGLGFDTGASETPIVPVVVGDTLRAFRMWRRLFDLGVFASAAVAPAVPEGRALIRTTAMATHTPAHIDRILEAFRTAGREAGVI